MDWYLLRDWMLAGACRTFDLCVCIPAHLFWRLELVAPLLRGGEIKPPIPEQGEWGGGTRWGEVVEGQTDYVHKLLLCVPDRKSVV